jgi:hypothetical protein
MLLLTRSCRVGLMLSLVLAGSGFAAAEASAETQVLSSDNRGLSFTLRVDSFRQTPGPDGFSIISYSGAVNVARPGEPDVPARRVAIGLPPEGDITLSAAGSGEELISDIDILPVPSYVREQPLFQRGPVFEQDGAVPASLVRLDNIGYLRGVRTATLLVFPVQYEPRRHAVRTYHDVTVQVRFTKPAQAQATSSSEMVGGILLNGELARQWATPLDTGVVRNFFDLSQVWYRVKIESTGVYKLTYNDLKQAGIDPSVVEPRDIRLFTVGDHLPNQAPDSMIEIPIHFTGRSDSVFTAQDYFIFYGQSSSHWDNGYEHFDRNLYTRYNYYWLTWGAGTGRRMAARSSPPGSGAISRLGVSRQRVEQDLLCPARSGNLWVWEEITKSENQDSVSAVFELPLNQPEQLDRVLLRLFSIDAEGDQNGADMIHVKVYFNDALLDSFDMAETCGAGRPLDRAYRFDSLGYPTLRTKNAVKLIITGPELRTMYLDFMELNYHCDLSLKSGELEFQPDSGATELVLKNAGSAPVILDITNPEVPARVTDFELRGDSARFARGGGAYFAALPSRLRKPLEIVRRTPGNLKSSDQQADYFIIAPDNLYDAAQLLQRYRTGNVRGIPNARVQTAKLSEIYDDFSFGLEEPGAIKAFLALKRPTYGLLVGDATCDYRDNLGLHTPPGVPPYEVGQDLDPQVYRSAAYALDAWYADFEGQGQSPDMVIGRIVARTPEEFRRYYDKLVSYERGDFGFWNKRFVLLADDEIKGSWDPVRGRDELGTYHIPSCEHMGAMAGSRLELAKVYLTEYPLADVNDKPGARDELFRQLDKGALLWVFFGHGAGFQLCHERAMGIDDVPRLNNGHRNFFGYFGSCGVGRWEDTKNECVAEELVRKIDGAIATVGATKATSPSSNEELCRRMLSLVFTGESTAGRAFYTGSFVDELYHYFGDPALVLQLPQGDTLPVATPDTIRAGARFSYAAQLPYPSGGYAATGFGNAKLRQYSSIWLTTSYLLPGDEFFRGFGAVQGQALNGTAMVPNQLLGARNVTNGSYTPVAKTARISVLAWDNTHSYSLLRDTLYLDTVPGPVTDHQGPEVKMLADGKEIFDGDYLPQDFSLSARISDSSGVLIAPVSKFSPSMYYYVNEPTQRVSVADKFSYDIGSSFTGRFESPVKLELLYDTIYVVAADNFLNRTIARKAVRTRFGEVVQIDNPLVYPNPVAGNSYFTFSLNRAARVDVSIHTISGRLVRRIQNQDCKLGYNQIPWDGTDTQGVKLPNGIYLYRLQAQSSDASSGAQRQTGDQVVEKFIVKH